MSLTQARLYLEMISPQLAILSLLALVVWSIVRNMLDLDKGPELSYALWAFAGGVSRYVVVAAGFYVIDELRPWTVAAGSTVAAHYLLKRLSRAYSEYRSPSRTTYGEIARLQGENTAKLIELVPDTDKPLARLLPIAHSSDSSELIIVPRTITPVTARAFIEACHDVGSNKFVTVLVDCEGGDSFATSSMHAALTKLNRSNSVTVEITGACMSGGMTLIMAVPLERRVAVPGALFMFHQSGGESAVGRAHVNEHIIFKPIADGTRISDISLRQALDSGQDTCFGAEDAVKLGVVSKII